MIKRAVLLVVFIITLSNGQPAYAQDVSSASAVVPTPVDYTLVYPGLLPDSPFYWLKTWRDKITGFFISGPLKKAEFDLLQADKHIQAAHLLVVQKKRRMDLVTKTLANTDYYFNQAIVKAGMAKQEGIDNREFLKKLKKANLKYQQVLQETEADISGSDKEIFVAEQKKLQRLADTVSEKK